MYAKALSGSRARSFAPSRGMAGYSHEPSATDRKREPSRNGIFVDALPLPESDGRDGVTAAHRPSRERRYVRAGLLLLPRSSSAAGLRSPRAGGRLPAGRKTRWLVGRRRMSMFKNPEYPEAAVVGGSHHDAAPEAPGRGPTSGDRNDGCLGRLCRERIMIGRGGSFRDDLGIKIRETFEEGAAEALEAGRSTTEH